MTCNDDDCLSCNPLYYCDKHDVEHRWYDECYMCDLEADEEKEKQ